MMMGLSLNGHWGWLKWKVAEAEAQERVGTGNSMLLIKKAGKSSTSHSVEKINKRKNKALSTAKRLLTCMV